MGNSRRNADRTNFLRQLSQAAAGWKAEVLRPSVPLSVPPEIGAKETGAGREGSELGNEVDVGPECDHCGGPLPERSPTGKLTRCDRQYCSPHCYYAATDPRRLKWLGRCIYCDSPLLQTSRSSRIYCSAKCSQDDRTRLERAARAEDNSSKSCAECGQPMPADKQLGAVYCSNGCACRAARARKAAKAKAKRCECCGSEFQTDKPSRRFCSHACSVEATRVHPLRTCEYCGSEFRSRNYGAIYCSLSCLSKAGWASGRLRHFPRKLTAERLDRLLAPRRPKRRYIQRLTPDRLDRLLAKVSP